MSSGTVTVALRTLSPSLTRSRASLLDRATTYIKYLEMTQEQFQMRLQQAENETARLRQCVISLSIIDCSTHVIHVGSTRC
jgi:hypothetical protein